MTYEVLKSFSPLMVSHLCSCRALEAVALAPSAGAVCAGAVALGRLAALALRGARQFLGGGDEDAVRLTALPFAWTVKTLVSDKRATYYAAIKVQRMAVSQFANTSAL